MYLSSPHFSKVHGDFVYLSPFWELHKQPYIKCNLTWKTETAAQHRHPQNPHDMYNPHLGGKKVVVTKSDSQREPYIQNGDAASRRPVRFFTHNSGNHPELRFKCKISTATTAAVLNSSERSYHGSSRTKHRVGLAVKLSFLWVGEEGRASPDSGGLLALQTSPLRLMYLWV